MMRAHPIKQQRSEKPGRKEVTVMWEVRKGSRGTDRINNEGICGVRKKNNPTSFGTAA